MADQIVINIDTLVDKIIVNGENVDEKVKEQVVAALRSATESALSIPAKKMHEYTGSIISNTVDAHSKEELMKKIEEVLEDIPSGELVDGSIHLNLYGYIHRFTGYRFPA